MSLGLYGTQVYWFIAHEVHSFTDDLYIHTYTLLHTYTYLYIHMPDTYIYLYVYIYQICIHIPDTYIYQIHTYIEHVPFIAI